MGRRGDIYSITELTSEPKFDEFSSAHARAHAHERSSRIIYRYRSREGTLIKRGAYRQLFLILFPSRFAAASGMIGFTTMLEVMLRVFQVFLLVRKCFYKRGFDFTLDNLFKRSLEVMLLITITR